MFEKARLFFQSPKGKGVAIGLVVIGLVAIFFSIKSNLGATPAEELSRTRMYICAETGKTFKHDVSTGPMYPVDSPASGKKTGYPAELCYWTKDGHLKKEPTYVLLNEWAKKKGPTFCPDCGRLVTAQNAPPVPGDRPPPTQKEYKPPTREQ